MYLCKYLNNLYGVTAWCFLEIDPPRKTLWRTKFENTLNEEFFEIRESEAQEILLFSEVTDIGDANINDLISTYPELFV